MRCCKPMFPSCEAANSLEKFFSYLHATSRGGDSILTYLTYLQRFPHDTRSCTKKLMDVWICGLAILESYVDLQLKLLPFLRSCSLTSRAHNIKCRRDTFHLPAYDRLICIDSSTTAQKFACFLEKNIWLRDQCYAMLQSYVGLQLKLLPPLRSFPLTSDAHDSIKCRRDSSHLPAHDLLICTDSSTIVPELAFSEKECVITWPMLCVIAG